MEPFELDLNDLEGLHDFVYEDLEALDIDLGQELLNFEDPEAKPDYVEVEMNVIFDDDTEAHIVVSAPDAKHVLGALLVAGGDAYIEALAASLGGVE